MTVSKKLACWSAGIATFCVLYPPVLSVLGREPVSDVATAVFPACIAYLITYAGKSAAEKLSRNKHGLDKNGVPWAQAGTKNEQDVGA